MSISIINVPVPATGDGPIVNLATLVGEKTVELSGTFKGKYILLGTQNGSAFVPVAMFDSDGKEDMKQTLPLALIAVKVRALADLAVGVNVNVSGVASFGSNKFATVASIAPGASGVQPVVDLFAVFPPTGIEQDIGLLCSGGFRGVALIEGSLDNIDFNPIGIFPADSRPSALIGLPPVLEFGPLTTKNLIRYIRVTLNGVVSSTVTVTIGGSVPATGSTPVNLPIADWDQNLIRYIFLDGDSGNDASLGFIDAPGGTDFTSVMGLVASVAVKTTHRINEIRKNVGAGRSVVVLIKPRAGNAIYDALTPGDGLGQDDRSLCSNYHLMYTRGSDLTNSPADRQQLGFTIAFPGPNGDGSWNVGTVTTTVEGPTIQFVGATLPAKWELPFYRIRYVHAGVTHYTSIRWGDVTGNALDVLTAWFLPSPLNPGNHIWLEKPGAVLFGYSESSCSDTTTTNQSPSSSMDGLLFSGGPVYLGHHDDDEAPCHYSNFGTVIGTNAFISGTGNVSIDGVFRDEINNVALFDGLGLAAWYINFNGTRFTMESSILATGGSGDAEYQSSILAEEMNVDLSSIQTCDFAKGSIEHELSNLNYGSLTFFGNAHTGIAHSRGINAWNSVLTASPANSDSTKSFSFQDLHNLLAISGQAEPTSPGIILHTGRYTCVFDLLDNTSIATGGTTIECGSGVRIEYNLTGTEFTIAKYGEDCLGTTGFEVIGGQKVVMMATGVVGELGFPGSVLPCPRGTPMRVIDILNPCTDEPQPLPCGLVVYGKTDSGENKVFYADAAALIPVNNILGVTLTNNNASLGGGNFGGWVIVSNDPILRIRKNSGSPAPTIGASIFLAYIDGIITGTFASSADDAFNPVLCLGYVLPTGTPFGLYATVFWQPGHHENQAKLLVDDNFVKTSDTTLEDVTGLFVQLETGLSYKIRAHLRYSTNSSPINGGLKVAMGGTATAVVVGATFSVIGMQELSDAPGNPPVPVLEWVAALDGIGDAFAKTHTGGVSGWIDIEGVIKVAAGGILYVRFAQETAVGQSFIDSGSSLTAIRTM
jgi:hypothetical protein